jgi:hypothetical protein
MSVSAPERLAEEPTPMSRASHPGSRNKRVRIETVDAIEHVRLTEPRPAGARPRDWIETLDVLVNAGLVALGYDPLFPDGRPTTAAGNRRK